MNTTQKPAVSLVIVTWNAKRYALECLDSLRVADSKIPMEVIVVDNASTDGTPEVIREQYQEVRLIQNGSNLGFARANNIGIAAATGDYICLVNSDVVVGPGCFEKMLAYMVANPNVGLLGPKMRLTNGRVGQSVNQLPTVWNYSCFALGLHFLMPHSKYLGGYIMAGYQYDKTEDVQVLTGWFWMARASALQEVGGLDEQFFMYGEDLDWSYRFGKAGWRVVFFAEAEALHYGGASSSQAATRFYVEMMRANLQFFRKHYGWRGSVGFVLATAVHEILRVLLYSVRYCLNGYGRSQSALKLARSFSCLRWMMRGLAA